MKLRTIAEVLDFEHDEEWEEAEFNRPDSVIPITKISSRLILKALDENFEIGDDIIPRFVALSDSLQVVNDFDASWRPVYSFSQPDLIQRSPHPISVYSWHTDDSTMYPSGMSAAFRNNQYTNEKVQYSKADTIAKDGDEIIISVPCKIIDRFDYDEDRNIHVNANGDVLSWEMG